MTRILLLGPQRLQPTLGSALQELEIEGPVALVTAGWRDAEGETDDLALEAKKAGAELVELSLYHRMERVFDADPQLHQTLRRRQHQLKQLQRIYRRRLDCALDGYRDLLGLRAQEEDDQALIDRERLAALEVVRDLDQHHLDGVEKMRLEVDQELTDERPVVLRERDEINRLIEPCTALVVAGGHVASLLNRLRMFDIKARLGDRPVVAWSAGAMALSERIVLFHDSPPWGAGNSEVLDYGLGLFRGVLPLPHARRRLRLEDPQRVELLVRRFAPLRSVGLDEGARLSGRGATWQGEPVWSGDGVRLLDVESLPTRLSELQQTAQMSGQADPVATTP